MSEKKKSEIESLVDRGRQQFTKREKVEKKKTPAEQTGQRRTPDPDKPYLTVNEKGKVQFRSALMAFFFEKHFNPVVCEGPDNGLQHFKYDKEEGFWRFLPLAELRHFAAMNLDEYAKRAWIEDAVYVFSNRVYVDPKFLKADPMMLNLSNGMYRLPTMEREDHHPKFNSRIQLPIEYDSNAKCPLWLKSLSEIFEDDPAKINILKEFAGYALFPKIIFPAALFCIGATSTGKSTIMETLTKLVGLENVCSISLQRMEENFGLAELKDKLLNVVTESSIRATEVTQFKAITSGDLTQATQKFLPDLKFYPYCKHLIGMNEFPKILDQTGAFYRRMIPLQFTRQFVDDADNKHLGDELLLELPGILNWAIEGLQQVLENDRIEIPDSIRRLSQELREEGNYLITFVDDECVLGSNNKVVPKVLWQQFRTWFDESGMKEKERLSMRAFHRKIRQTIPGANIQKRRHGSKMMFFGIDLRGDEQEQKLEFDDEIPF